jgi:hypothetical protein
MSLISALHRTSARLVIATGARCTSKICGRSIFALRHGAIKAAETLRCSQTLLQALSYPQTTAQARTFSTARVLSATATSNPQVKQFDPPGGLQELDEKQKVEWSNWVSSQFDQAVTGYPQYFTYDGPRDQFYNPAKTEAAADGKAAKVSWIGFPRNVQVANPNDKKRWEIADSSRDVQDEYCEWNVHRDQTTTKITRVVFTCENPEYWDFLGKYNPDLLLKLYQKYVGNQVKREDLFSATIQKDNEFQPNYYIRKNKWNSNTTTGIMHLVQDNNSLGAEIELAGGSSVVRQINGRVLTGQQELIKCGRYGGEQRNSDPFIGAQVNALTRQKAFVTLINPVGLYFDTFQPQGWETPDGSDPASYWKIVRGTQEAPVRVIYEVPKEKGFAVGDITINGSKIQYGAQIADFVRIKLTAYAQNFGKSTAVPLTGCRVKKPQPAAFVASATVKPKIVTRSN